MKALNSVLIEGDVIAIPEKRETPKGITVCDFKIASSCEEGKSIFSVESWAALADVCSEHCTEGRGVRVVGRLKQCEDGSIKVVAEHVEFKPQTKKSS
jgi:single-strand DNA-binding protein